MALPVRNSGINNNPMKETGDDGHFVLATHLNFNTDFNNFTRNIRPLRMNFGTFSYILDCLGK